MSQIWLQEAKLEVTSVLVFTFSKICTSLVRFQLPYHILGIPLPEDDDKQKAVEPPKPRIRHVACARRTMFLGGQARRAQSSDGSGDEDGSYQDSGSDGDSEQQSDDEQVQFSSRMSN